MWRSQRYFIQNRMITQEPLASVFLIDSKVIYCDEI